MGTGYADIQNPLFFKENTQMLLGSAKDVLVKLHSALAEHYKKWVCPLNYFENLNLIFINLKKHFINKNKKNYFM